MGDAVLAPDPSVVDRRFAPAAADRLPRHQGNPRKAAAEQRVEPDIKLDHRVKVGAALLALGRASEAATELTEVRRSNPLRTAPPLHVSPALARPGPPPAHHPAA